MADSELTRVSMSLEENLLKSFDKLTARRGYETRSEALRDLIRDAIIRDNARAQTGVQVAVVTMVFDHHARELASKLVDKQHHHHDIVVSTMHIHLGPHHCLEVTVLRGPAKQVTHLADELLATKGVLHGEITFTTDEAGFREMK